MSIIASAPKLIGIPSSEYPTKAKRPAYSRLDTTRFARDFGLHLPDWRRQEAFDLLQGLVAIGVIGADLDRPDEAVEFALDLAASFLEVILARSNLVVARLDEAAA